MSWFTPLNRADHPCVVPNQEERSTHRAGDMFRCEICGELWVLRDKDEVGYPYDKPTFEVVFGPLTRWRHRKKGWSGGEA